MMLKCTGHARFPDLYPFCKAHGQYHEKMTFDAAHPKGYYILARNKRREVIEHFELK